MKNCALKFEYLLIFPENTKQTGGMEFNMSFNVTRECLSAVNVPECISKHLFVSATCKNLTRLDEVVNILKKCIVDAFESSKSLFKESSDKAIGRTYHEIAYSCRDLVSTYNCNAIIGESRDLPLAIIKAVLIFGVPVLLFGGAIICRACQANYQYKKD